MDHATSESKKIRYSFLRSSLFAAIIIVATLGFGGRAHAATLSASPSAKNVNAGDIFSVSVLVNSDSVSINSAETVLRFPSNLLEVVSVGKSGSVFSLWVEEPAYNNAQGTVTFSGGVPNPGYTGASGKVISITFRALTAGTASMLFEGATVRANDGLGTNVLTGASGATISVLGKVEKPTEVKEVSPKSVVANPAPGGAKPASSNVRVEVSSPSHPDEDAWYNNASPRFTWTVPPGTTEVLTGLSDSRGGEPRVVNPATTVSKTMSHLEGGVWYFTVRVKTAAGLSPIAWYRARIDTEPPVIVSFKDAASDPGAMEKKFAIVFQDSLSGIDHVDVGLDGQAPHAWKDWAGGTYSAQALSSGEHTILFVAYDGAGNTVTQQASFTIQGVEAPKIVQYDSILKPGAALVVQGVAAPESKITLFLAHSGRLAIASSTAEAAGAPKEDVATFFAQADDQGRFTVVTTPIDESGTYAFWVQATRTDGTVTQVTPRITVAVNESAVFALGAIAARTLGVLVPVVVLLLSLILVLWHFAHRMLAVRYRFKKDIGTVDDDIHRTFRILKRNMQFHLRTIEHANNERELTPEEIKIRDRVNIDIDRVEQYLSKEIREVGEKSGTKPRQPRS